MSSNDPQPEQPDASSAVAESPSPPDDLVEETAPEDPAGEPALTATDDADSSEDPLFGVVALGLMALLLICIVMVLIANGRPPAGL